MLPIIRLNTVTLLFLQADVQEERGTNLAEFGQNRMAVGTTMRRCSEDIGLHNTQVAGTTILQ